MTLNLENEKRSENTMSKSYRLFTFTGGNEGVWEIIRTVTVIGDHWPPAERLAVRADEGRVAEGSANSVWELRGITSNERYTNRPEKDTLRQRQEGLGRPSSTLAALIPIRKKMTWWTMTQDERRAVFEEQSKHIGIGLTYLPAIARRLHHCRDLSEREPFDFLTWFEFAPESETAFDRMLEELRRSPEWDYVDWEIDIRLRRV
jgi:hypothetical protein